MMAKGLSLCVLLSLTKSPVGQKGACEQNICPHKVQQKGESQLIFFLFFLCFFSQGPEAADLNYHL